MNKPAELTARLTREEWLRKAMLVLAAEGPAKLNIQNLAEALGVSRGSFYWHFKNRADFVRSLLEYWHDEYTKPVPGLVEAQGGSGRDKFQRFIRIIHERDLSQFDMPIRAWAMQDPEVAKLVRRTDRFRLDFLRGLLAEVGFRDRELELRARSCIAYITMDKRLFGPGGAIVDPDHIDDVCDFFIGERR